MVNNEGAAVQANGIENVIVGRMAAEEFAEAWRTKRRLTRLNGTPQWSHPLVGSHLSRDHLFCVQTWTGAL